MSSPVLSRKTVLRSSENVARKEDGVAKQQPRKKAPTVPKPEPPKPPRSAFMCFSDSKKREIMVRHGIVEENDDMLNIVANEWKSLSDRDRAHWDEEARNDKVRFVREKAAFKGSWTIPKRRAKKHPLAPKRPMSAFLKYSQTRRATVKTENPDMSNTDVSRLLGEMWRNASQQEKAPYVEQEVKEREVYKEKIKNFREGQARMDAASRSSHQSVQHQSYHHRGGYHHRQHPQQQSHAPLLPQQHHQQLQVPLPPPQQQHRDRPYSNGVASSSFESMHFDSLSHLEAGQKNDSKVYPYHPHQYTNTFPLYHKSQYHPQSDQSLHQSLDYQETEPVPVSRPSSALANSGAHPQIEEDDFLIEDRFAAARNNYFADMNIDYYTRFHH